MSLSDSCSARISGVAMGSIHLNSDHVVLDDDLEGVDRDVGGQVQRLPRLQVEEGAVARALDGAPLEVDLTLEEDPVVVRATIFDREDLAAAVHDPDLEVLDLHDARGAGRKLR